MNSGPSACMKAVTMEPSPCPQLFLTSKKRFVFMCMSLGVCMRAWWLWRPEEGGSPRAKVMDSCEMRVLERGLGPLQEQQVLLITALSLQPPFLHRNSSISFLLTACKLPFLHILSNTCYCPDTRNPNRCEISLGTQIVKMWGLSVINRPASTQ